MILWIVNHRIHNRSKTTTDLRKQATIDSLTEINNFGKFDQELNEAYKRYRDHGEAYALYTFDLDHFKQINDTYGHISGNQVLREVAAFLKRYTSELEYDSCVYRTGGEEFSFILFNVLTSFDRAAEISKGLQKGINSLSIMIESKPIHVTISLGQDRVTEDDKNYLDIYRRADSFLYNSKNSGRDALTIRGRLIR